MRESEYTDVLARFRATWPRQELSKATADAWLPLLVDLELDEVLAAVEAVAATSPFLPHPADLRNWVVEQRLLAEGLPLWAEVWAEVLRRIGSYGHQRWDEIPWSDGVRPFMEHVGRDTFQELCLGEETQLFAYEAQWRGKWEQWVRRERLDRSTHNLPAVKQLRGRRREDQLAAGEAVAALAAGKALGQPRARR